MELASADELPREVQTETEPEPSICDLKVGGGGIDFRDAQYQRSSHRGFMQE